MLQGNKAVFPIPAFPTGRRDFLCDRYTHFPQGRENNAPLHPQMRHRISYRSFRKQEEISGSSRRSEYRLPLYPCE